MKIDINKLCFMLNHKFGSIGYSQEISNSMTDAIINAEMYGKYTHGIIRVKWIIDNKLPNKSNYTFKKENFLDVYDCKNSNGYNCGYNIISNIIKKSLQKNDFNISIVKNIFPTTCFIDYLNQFEKENIGAILMGTTPKLVGVRNGGKKILGTNPIGFTFPNDNVPIIADLGTSNVPLGKIIHNSMLGNKSDMEIMNKNGELYEGEEYYENNTFHGTLLPFGGINYEHKGFIFSLLIELITTMFSGKRSEKGDLLIISFNENCSFYKKSAITELFNDLLNTQKDLIIPGNKSLEKYKKSKNQKYINIEHGILSEIGLTEIQIKNIQYQ